MPRDPRGIVSFGSRAEGRPRAGRPPPVSIPFSRSAPKLLTLQGLNLGSTARGCIHQRAVNLVLHRTPALVIALCQVVDGVCGFRITNAFDTFASVTLLARKELQALFEIASDHSLHRTAVRADDLREKIPTHQWLAAMLLLGDNL